MLAGQLLKLRRNQPKIPTLEKTASVVHPKIQRLAHPAGLKSVFAAARKFKPEAWPTRPIIIIARLLSSEPWSF
jgi:hypothetical protein